MNPASPRILTIKGGSWNIKFGRDNHKESRGSPSRTALSSCCAGPGEANPTQPGKSVCTPLIRGGLSPIELFSEGDDLYHSMLDAIGQARKNVRLETYIFADDEVGRMFAESLARQVREGVDVRLMIDAAGSLFWGTRRLRRFLSKSGVRVKWYHRWSWRHPFRYNQRNHRKLLVVDDRCAFLGGFNIHRENSRVVYGERRWRDTHVRVNEDLAMQCAAQFDAVWDGKKEFRDAPKTEALAVVLSNVFRNCRHRFRCLYRERIEQATSCVFLTTPYFVPDRQTLGTLLAAARRGLDVRLLVPAKSDVIFVQWAARAMYTALLQAGIRVFEYRPRILHAKCAAFDGAWSIIGSSNIDYRSFGINYEISLVAHDQSLADRLTEQFLHDLDESNEIRPEAWGGRQWSNRVFEWIGRVIGGWL